MTINGTLSKGGLAALLLFPVLAGGALAGGPGTAGGTFLNVGMGARAASLGGTGAAARGVEAVAWNPAGLAYMSGPEVQLTHLDWLESVTFDDAAVGLGTRQGGFALWVRKVGMDPINGYTTTGAADGTYNASDTSVSVGLGRAYGRWSAGAAAKYISSTIDSEGASSAALDAGVQYELGSRAIVGFAVRNLGPGLKFEVKNDPLPAAARLGCRYLAVNSGDGALSLYLDAEKPRDRRTDLYAGAEYAATRRRGVAFYLRGGFRTRMEGLAASDAFTAGVGLSVGNFSLSYAYAPYGELGTASRFTAGWSFGKPAAAAVTNAETNTERKNNE